MAYEGNPNWPALFNTNHVFGTWVDLEGNPEIGTIVFTARPAVLKVLTSGVAVVPVPLTAELDGFGSIDFELPITDDPDVQPQQWTYGVEEQLDNGKGRSYDVVIPGGDPVNMLLASPMQPSIGLVQYFGPPGPPGPPSPGTPDIIDGGGA